MLFNFIQYRAAQRTLVGWQVRWYGVHSSAMHSHQIRYNAIVNKHTYREIRLKVGRGCTLLTVRVFGLTVNKQPVCILMLSLSIPGDIPDEL